MHDDIRGIQHRCQVRQVVVDQSRYVFVVACRITVVVYPLRGISFDGLFSNQAADSVERLRGAFAFVVGASLLIFIGFGFLRLFISLPFFLLFSGLVFLVTVYLA